MPITHRLSTHATVELVQALVDCLVVGEGWIAARPCVIPPDRKAYERLGEVLGLLLRQGRRL